jgi:hypothetical protein
MSLKAGLTLAQTRREAKTVLGGVARDGDSLGAKPKAPALAGNTLQVVAQEYFKREAAKLASQQRQGRRTGCWFPVPRNRHIGDNQAKRRGWPQ